MTGTPSTTHAQQAANEFPRSDEQEKWSHEDLGDYVCSNLGNGDFAARSMALRASFDIVPRPDGTTRVRPRIWPAEERWGGVTGAASGYREGVYVEDGAS